MGVDLGSLGPLLVGAGGGIVLVFFTGFTATDTGTDGDLSISYAQLVAFAIAGGAAGQVIFRSLAEGKKISLDSANQAVLDAADKGKEAAEDDTATPDTVKAEVMQAGLDSLKE